MIAILVGRSPRARGRTGGSPHATCQLPCAPGCDGRGVHPAKSSQDTHRRSCVLQGRKKGERGLCALIEIGSADLQAIKGSAGCGVPHDDRSVVVTLKPVCGGADAVHPPPVVVNRHGAGTRIGHCRHFDGLLVESRSMVCGAATPDGRDREMPLVALAIEQPCQEIQPAAS